MVGRGDYSYTDFYVKDNMSFLNPVQIMSTSFGMWVLGESTYFRHSNLAKVRNVDSVHQYWDCEYQMTSWTGLLGSFPYSCVWHEFRRTLDVIWKIPDGSKVQLLHLEATLVKTPIEYLGPLWVLSYVDFRFLVWFGYSFMWPLSEPCNNLQEKK